MKRSENTGIEFNRQIEKAEYDQVKDGGHMLRSNQTFSPKFDYEAYSDVLYLFAALVVGFLVLMKMSGAGRIGFIVFAVFLACVSSAWLIYSIVNTCKIAKISSQKQNVYPVAMNIDGTCSYYNTYDFTSATFYYIVSGDFLILVSEKMYKKAPENKKLIGAVVDTGSKRFFYAMYVI